MTQAARQLNWYRRTSLSLRDVHEIDARRHLADEHLTRPRPADVDALPFEDLRAPVLVQSDGLRHDCFRPFS